MTRKERLVCKCAYLQRMRRTFRIFTKCVKGKKQKKSFRDGKDQRIHSTLMAEREGEELPV